MVKEGLIDSLWPRNACVAPGPEDHIAEAREPTPWVSWCRVVTDGSVLSALLVGSLAALLAVGFIDFRRHRRTEVFAFLAAVIIGEKLIVVFGGPAQRLGDPSPTARKAPPPGRTMPHGPASTDESSQARRKQAE